MIEFERKKLSFPTPVRKENWQPCNTPWIFIKTHPVQTGFSRVFPRYRTLWLTSLQAFHFSPLQNTFVVDGKYKTVCDPSSQEAATQQNRNENIIYYHVKYVLAASVFIYFIYLGKYRSTLLKFLAFFSTGRTNDRNAFWLRKIWFFGLKHI